MAHALALSRLCHSSLDYTDFRGGSDCDLHDLHISLVKPVELWHCCLITFDKKAGMRGRLCES